MSEESMKLLIKKPFINKEINQKNAWIYEIKKTVHL
jgi:hypothetical protein